MPLTPEWEIPTEWPKLDLPKYHLIRLGLVWSVPFTDWAEEQFGELLGPDGSFIAVLSYTRGRVLHYRVETAQLGPDEDDPLLVTVQYRCDTEGLPEVPKFLQEAAWLLDPLMAVQVASAVECHADFTFPDSPRLRTVVPLPSSAAPLDVSPYVIDEIRGIRGVKHDDEEFGLPGYSFTLDRLSTNEIALSLDFVQAAGPPDGAAKAALDNAVFIARRLAWEERKRRPPTPATDEQSDPATAAPEFPAGS